MPTTSPALNVANRLAETARRMPEATAVIEPMRGQGYRRRTFAELDADAQRIARGLVAMGVEPGMRLALLVRPGIDFVTLVFALFRSSAVTILIDPGMGRRRLIGCLEEAQPRGFVAIPAVQAVRSVLQRAGRLLGADRNVTVGRPWFWKGPSLDELRAHGERHDGELPTTTATDPAAIIFTTGSTGPPKGVLYRHGNFDAQVTELRDRYDIQPGGVDLAGFPLFGLFNGAMGVTTVIPRMDPTRPASVDPRKIVRQVDDLGVTQAFGSPAMWYRVGGYCSSRGVQLPTLRQVFSAGAPVSAEVLRMMKAVIDPEGEVHTPYGATEALPVASISATEVLGETSQRTEHGAGVCVGQRFEGMQWKVIRIRDDAIGEMAQAEELDAGEIGELVVRGAVVTREYVTRVEANGLSKIADGGSVWHRMGDVGYLDDEARFWFCGRKAHRVQTTRGTMYTVPCEAIFNVHPAVYRSALVGIGPVGSQTPVLVVQPYDWRMFRRTAARRKLIDELSRMARGEPLTETIERFLIRRALPVDIRHNAKIFREQLAVWAARVSGSVSRRR